LQLPANHASVAEIVELDLQLGPQGTVEAYRAKVKVSFRHEAKS
jgi:hypothetical protein